MSRRNQSRATVEALMNKAEQAIKAEELKTAEQTAEAVEEQTAEASKSFEEMTKAELGELLKLSATELKKLKKEELVKLATEQSKAEETAEATETATEQTETAEAEQKQSKAKIDSKAEAEAVKKLCKTAEATTNSEGHIIIKAKGYLLKIQISSRAIKLRCNQKFATASELKTVKHDGWNVKYELFCSYKEAVEKLEELATEQTAEATA